MKKFLSFLTVCALLFSTVFVFAAYAIAPANSVETLENNTDCIAIAKASAKEASTPVMTAYEDEPVCKTYGGIVYLFSTAVSKIVSCFEDDSTSPAPPSQGSGIVGPIEPY